MSKRNRLWFALVMVVVFITFYMAFVYSEVGAEEYPSKPITIIHPWPPGGTGDILSRALISVMGQYLPTRLLLVNRPGAGGTIGTTEICNAKADGYTIGVISWGPVVTQPNLKNLDYTEDDYSVILQLQSAPMYLVAHKDAPYSNMEELVEFVNKNAPGTISCGNPGVGSIPYFTSHLLQRELGAEFTNVPFKGGGPTITALLGKHIDLAFSVVSEAVPYIESGELIAIAVTSDKRFKDNEIPTMLELGYDVEAYVATFLIGPSGMPNDVFDTLHDSFKSGMEDEAYIEIADKMGIVTEYLGPEESVRKIRNFRILYGELSQALGIEKE